MAIPGYVKKALRDVYVGWANLYVLDKGDEDLIVALGKLRAAIERSEGKADVVFMEADNIWATLDPASKAVPVETNVRLKNGWPEVWTRGV